MYADCCHFKLILMRRTKMFDIYFRFVISSLSLELTHTIQVYMSWSPRPGKRNTWKLILALFNFFRLIRIQKLFPLFSFATILSGRRSRKYSTGSNLSVQAFVPPFLSIAIPLLSAPALGQSTSGESHKSPP